MGCDIHAVIETKGKYCSWINRGDPEIDRNYLIFSVLGNVRNHDDIPFISSERGVPENCSDAYESMVDRWDSDAHSKSWVTLKELKDYDIKQKYHCSSLITSKNKDGSISETCGSTNRPHMGEVGEVTIFGLWGHQAWFGLIGKLEKLSSGDNEDVRICFFFDN